MRVPLVQRAEYGNVTAEGAAGVAGGGSTEWRLQVRFFCVCVYVCWLVGPVGPEEAMCV